METYKYDKSYELLDRAKKVIPSGIYGHLGGVKRLGPADAYPLFSDRAKGAYFWDVDDNKFLDYMCAFGPNVLGYGDDEVNQAALKQAAIGDSTTAPSRLFVDFAELMVDTVASADWAFFAKNGSDVTTLAVMTARAATGRKKMILVNGYYHGSDPWAQRKDGPGVIEEDTANNIYVDWLNFDQLEKVVSENKGEIAGLISSPYFHAAFADNLLPDKDYWQKVRKLCTDNGIVLIIDDVRCGFRLDLAGSDHYFGFKADLICFCKAIANGWNVSALCGIDALRDTVSSIQFTGSYWYSAVPFAAGIACINKLKRIDGVKMMNDIGTSLTSGLVDVASSNGFKLITSGAPSLFYLRIANDDSLTLHKEWIGECVRRGVYLTYYHNMFTNCSISEVDIKFSLDVADEAFKVVKTKHPELIV